MNFAETAARGYIYKSNDPRNVEIKFLMRNVNIGDHGFSISGPTGRHSGSGCCSGFAYMLNLETTTNPIDFRFRKEMWHVSYHTDPITDVWTHPDFNFKLQGHSGSIGIGYVRYNKPNGISSGKDSVIIEAWGNPDPDNNPSNWKLLKRTEDKGAGWGNDGDKCNGNKGQVGTWGGPKYRMKSNGSGSITFKNLSFREIDPFGSFDDDPSNPPPPPTPIPGGTTTITGTFKFQQDINTSRSQSACAGTTSGEPPSSGGGTGSGLTRFWSVPANHDKEISNSSTFDNRTRVAERIKSSSSRLKGKVPTQADVPLKKVGSPSSSPTIHCKIWNSSNHVVFDSPTTVDPSTLTTNFVYKTFDFSANTHTLVVGDIIGVEWTGTSDNNYIETGYEDEAVDEVSIYVNYESGSWEEKGSRDWASDIWES